MAPVLQNCRWEEPPYRPGQFKRELWSRPADRSHYTDPEYYSYLLHKNCLDNWIYEEFSRLSGADLLVIVGSQLGSVGANLQTQKKKIY